jgi:hypothetical protein
MVILTYQYELGEHGKLSRITAGRQANDVIDAGGVVVEVTPSTVNFGKAHVLVYLEFEHSSKDKPASPEICQACAEAMIAKIRKS